jgi:predicted nucleic-acid-binding Zn-ribbon protein
MFEKEAETAGKVEMFGREFHCQVCGNNEFWRREAQLNTAIATFFNFDWADQTAICLVCDECGYIHWFLPR